MVKVHDPVNNRDLGDVTDAALLNYYIGEGYQVEGAVDPTAVVVTDSVPAGVLTRPGRSASKAAWHEYAALIDPNNAAVAEMTRDELIQHYGAPE